MIRVRVTLMLVLFVVLSAGCENLTPPAPTFTVRDSAGIEIVESAAPLLGPDAWTISEEPVLQIGEVEGEDPLATFEAAFDTVIRPPQMVIMPTFNDLMGGLPVNADTPKSLLGPLFRSGAVDVGEFDVYLLDGAFLGKISFLRTLITDPTSMD